jgi:glutamine synthetase
MDDFQKVFEENNIEFIQFQYTDILGNFKGVDFPVGIWDDMKEGTGIDGSSVGFVRTEQSDMRIVPDLGTFSIFPWNPNIGRFICNITDNHGKPHPACPRSLLMKLINQIEEKGYKFQIRPELEWYLLKKNFEPADNASYMDLFPKDPLEKLRRKIAQDMLKMGIDIKTIHHENGPGQHEIEFKINDALIQSDNIQTAKLISKIEAHNANLIATYMPKPIAGKAGSGLHIHQYLTKNNRNIFADEKGDISDILKFFIGCRIQYSRDRVDMFLNTPNKEF